MFKRDRNIIVYIALLLYRIPLSHIIGDNGVGYLSGPMEIFIGLSLLFGSGFTLTMHGMMRDRVRHDQYRNAGQVFRLGKRIAFISSILITLISILAYDFVSSKILFDGGQRLAFLFTGPAIAVSIFVSLNKGYLLGTENGQACIFAEILEAVFDGIGLILGAIVGQRYGIKIAALLHYDDVSAMYGAMGAMIGLLLGEIITLIVYVVMVIIYQRSFRHLTRGDISRRVEYTSDVSSRLISGFVFDGLQNMIIQLPILLLIIFYRRYGVNAEISNVNSMVGAFYAKYLSVVGIISGFAVIVIPNGAKGILAAFNDNEEMYAADRFGKLLARIAYFTIPAVVFTTLLTPVIIDALFNGMITTASSTLTVGSFVIILYALMYLFMSVLLRMDYNKELLFISGISIVAVIVLGFIFVDKQGKGLTGMAITLMIFYGINMIFDLFVLLRNIRIRINLISQIVLPLIVAVITGLVLKLISGVLLGAVGSVITLAICIIPGWIIYNIACIFLRVVNASQMERKLFGPIFVKIGQNMGIY